MFFSTRFSVYFRERHRSFLSLGFSWNPPGMLSFSRLIPSSTEFPTTEVSNASFSFFIPRCKDSRRDENRKPRDFLHFKSSSPRYNYFTRFWLSIKKRTAPWIPGVSFLSRERRSVTLVTSPLLPLFPLWKSTRERPRCRTISNWSRSINDGRVGQRLLKSASRTITAACSTAAFSASVVNLPCYKKEKERKEEEEREKREGKGKGRGRGKEKGAEGKGKRREKRTRVSLSFAA